MRVAGEHWATPDGAAYDGVRLGETVERPDASRKVVQTGEVLEIAAVATEQDLTQVVEAVDRLSEGGEGAGCWALPMFTLRSCLKAETSLVVVSMRRTRPNLS